MRRYAIIRVRLPTQSNLKIKQVIASACDAFGDEYLYLCQIETVEIINGCKPSGKSTKASR